jgi:aminocarboxymuconate-semialdehyde decarboxylase
MVDSKGGEMAEQPGLPIGAVVDVHWHWTPPAYIRALEQPDNPWGERVVREDGGLTWLTASGAPRLRPLMEGLYDPEAQVRELDRRGVDTAAVSAPPMLFGEHLEAEKALDLHRMVNDEMAALAARYPGRFAPLAAVPLQAPGLAVRELERAMGELGLAGVEICSNIAGRNLDEPDFLPFFERAGELGAFVFVHPSNVIGSDRLRRYYLTNLIGNPTDTAVAVASLIFGGVYDRAPGLVCCFAHGGGAFPMLLGRLAHGWRVRPEGKAAIARSPREYLPRIYCDTLTHDDRARRLLIDTLGADHVLLGSDHPFDMGDTEPVLTVRQTPGLSETEQSRILGGTAARLLRRTHTRPDGEAGPG